MENNTRAEGWWMPIGIHAEQLKEFKPIEGALRARRGKIDGVEYVAKCSWGEGPNQDDLVHNECVCDRFFRLCGMNVPETREYEVDFGRGPEKVRLAVYRKPNFGIILPADVMAASVGKVVAPLVFAGRGDAFEDGSVMEDEYGNYCFVSNSASFKYDAAGEFRPGWNYVDPDGADGFWAMLDRHVTGVLGRSTRWMLTGTLIKAARRFDFEKLVAQLPADYAAELKDMAEDWNAWRNAGKEPERHFYGVEGNMPLTCAELQASERFGMRNRVLAAFIKESANTENKVWVTDERVSPNWDGSGSRYRLVYVDKEPGKDEGVKYLERLARDFIIKTMSCGAEVKFALADSGGNMIYASGDDLRNAMYYAQASIENYNRKGLWE